MAEHGTQRRQRPGMAILVPLALLASSAVVYQASNAAFSATTTNGANSWQSGSVALSDNDSGVAMFSVTGLSPGDTGEKCIVVTYGGSLNAAVTLYATSYTDSGLGQYLDLTIQEGTGAQANCSDFSSSATLHNTDLDAFATTSTGFGTGVSSWAPAGGSAATKTFRFAWTLQDDNGAMGKSSQVTFTWEAQNT
ncbi:MAG: hypothetical protein JNL54_00100 [Kineosporiaceae bacterium]|nr:hypothetical protein [Kineosporiaceae bacterium]